MVSWALSAAAVAADGQPRTNVWRRSNHAGRPVTLLGGPAAVGAVVVGGLVQLRQRPPRRPVLALLMAGVGAGLVGAYDDLHGDGESRGYRGHLLALRGGTLTSGAVKVVGVGLSAAIAAGVLDRSGAGQGAPAAGYGRRSVEILTDTALIALSANLVNLFDLRAGRSAKVVLVLAAPLFSRGAAPVLGAALGSLPTDLGERSMLGDCGANGLGAALATVAAAALPLPVRLAAVVGVAVLNGLSERVSFTAVIAANPALAWLDQLGRRAPPAPDPRPPDPLPPDPAPPDLPPPDLEPGGARARR